jgi:hypothetical protein
MRYAAILLAILALTSCRYFEDDAQFGYSRTGFTTPSAFTTADVRIITERENPITHQKVICTEPSPDVAKAISTAFSASGSGGNGTATGNVAFSGANAEAVAELAGRSTALLGLRDGLYRACEAYANGVIGSDTYALIVSRYGQLMTTLFLGQDIADAARAQASTQANSPADPASPASGNTQQKSTSGDTAQTPSQATAPPASTTPSSSPTPTAVPSANPAAAIARMNEDYMSLDLTNLLHTLSVVCINQNDPTVEAPPDLNYSPTAAVKFRQTNPWLQQVCPQIATALNSEALNPAQALSILTKAGLLASPVNPMVTTSATATKPTNPSTGKQTASTCTTMTTAQIATATEVLQAQPPSPATPYLAKGSVSSIDFDVALTNFQNANSLTDTCKPGQIGSKTLSAIQKLAPSKPKK